MTENILSDEDRVKNLLKGQNGRMYQKEIVATVGWSDAKVSLLLSDMADEGEIHALRIGRDRIISLTPLID